MLIRKEYIRILDIRGGSHFSELLCVYAGVSVCTCVDMYACMGAHVCACMCTSMCVCECVCSGVHYSLSQPPAHLTIQLPPLLSLFPGPGPELTSGVTEDSDLVPVTGEKPSKQRGEGLQTGEAGWVTGLSQAGGAAKPLTC